MRLLLPELFSHLDKILYLDCDVIVNTDIVKLWNTPIDNYFLAACHDEVIVPQWPNQKKRYYISKDIPVDSYFNSGVLLLNLKKLRENKFTETAFDFLVNNQDVEFPDEIALNWFCRGEYLRLDTKYNIFVFRKDAEQYIDDCILHYVGGSKPWDKYLGKYDDYYWHYLIQTPWCDDKREIVNYVRKAPDVHQAIPHLLSRFYAEIPGTRKEKLLLGAKFIAVIVKSTISDAIVIFRKKK